MIAPWPRGLIIGVWVGAILHTAVYAGRDANGVDWVIDLSPKRSDGQPGGRVLWRTLADFARGQTDICMLTYPRAASPETIFWRAVGQVGQHDYHWHDRNCQQFTRWCANGEWTSDQLEQARPLAVAAVAVAGLVAFGSLLNAA